MAEQTQSSIYVAGLGSSSSGSSYAQSGGRANLRVCQDCNYTTFSHYVKCPRCNSEKWTNRV